MASFLMVSFLFCALGANHVLGETCPTADPLQDPSFGCCGVEKERNQQLILNGLSVGLYEYPWAALIEYEVDGENQLLCGGSLISKTFVLTAAHCVAPSPRSVKAVNVVLGAYNIKSNGSDCDEKESGCKHNSVSIPIHEIQIHPSYSVRQKSNDIALIKLAKDAPYTDFIRPICLPTTDITQDPRENLKFEVTGWARDCSGSNICSKELENNIKYYDIDECKKVYNIRRIMLTSAQHICASSTCVGNSGAGLIYRSPTYSEVVGIVSLGPSAAFCDKSELRPPGVYTKIYDYLDWIKAIIV